MRTEEQYIHRYSPQRERSRAVDLSGYVVKKINRIYQLPKNIFIPFLTETVKIFLSAFFSK